MSKPQHLHRVRIVLPHELVLEIDKFINESRFQNRSELIEEAVQTWIDCEEDDKAWEVMAKHEEWDGESAHPYGCDGAEEDEEIGTGFVPTENGSK
jgi:Arc/MetJ-type ribon-helix-helix transcriptional regulator